MLLYFTCIHFSENTYIRPFTTVEAILVTKHTHELQKFPVLLKLQYSFDILFDAKGKGRNSCDFFILTLEQIIVLNKYCTYNKPISKISLCQNTLELV